MKSFDELIRELNLRDPPLCNGQFTWSSFRNQPTYCKLDRFLFSAEWEALFPVIRQEIEVRVVSDHCPVLLDSTPTRWGPSPFRFENMCLEHKSFNKDFEC
ncbi:Endonuclease/exonuclease/phosphatase [Trema orientale]|uniref:Endonuclease/exonuclease/phosphatase n=1 Tax=Trema orientale TaxID=63057 RepID=A0A2P5CR30_TREOI|nr:Endonuclease/exonuclease/phosphatase [Trema orientale]